MYKAHPIWHFLRLFVVGLLFVSVDAHATDSAAGWSGVGEAVSEISFFLDALAVSAGVSLVTLIILNVVLSPLFRKHAGPSLVRGMKVAAVVIPVTAITVFFGMFGIEVFALAFFGPSALLGGALYYRASRLTQKAPSSAEQESNHSN